MNNEKLAPLHARPGTLELFFSHARHPQTPLSEVEARLLAVCKREQDMDMYPVLLAGLREVYRLEELARRRRR